jgi:hypothetical protein
LDLSPAHGPIASSGAREIEGTAALFFRSDGVDRRVEITPAESGSRAYRGPTRGEAPLWTPPRHTSQLTARGSNRGRSTERRRRATPLFFRSDGVERRMWASGGSPRKLSFRTPGGSRASRLTIEGQPSENPSLTRRLATRKPFAGTVSSDGREAFCERAVIARVLVSGCSVFQ